jgi:hypothetical protein
MGSTRRVVGLVCYGLLIGLCMFVLFHKKLVTSLLWGVSFAVLYSALLTWRARRHR